MSSILDALKKVEDDDNGPEGGVELNEEIDAAAAERDIVAADSDAKKVTVRLTPAVMLVTLVVSVIVVTGIAAVTYFATRPDTSAVPSGRVAAAPRVLPDRPAVSPQTAGGPNTTPAAPAPVVEQPEPTATEPAPTAAQPEPAAAEPAPTVAQPEPAAAEPAQVVAQPEPAAAEPAPVVAQPEPAAAEPAQVVAQPEPAAAEPAPAVAQPEPAAAEPAPAAAEPTSAAKEPAGDVVAEELRPARPKPQQAVPSQQAAAPAPVAQPVQPPVALPVETAATFASDEPPPDIQSVILPVEVPDLEINIIRAANAENPKPVAVINLNTVYEGDLIAGTGIRVLKINDDSVWFSYQGYRFSKRFK